MYILQAIQKFERLNYPDVVLKLAEIAITEADFDDPELVKSFDLLILTTEMNIRKICNFNLNYTFKTDL